MNNKPHAKLRVLVVDDTTNWCDWLQELLEEDGRFEVQVAQTFDTATQMIDDNWYHVISLDIHLHSQKPNRDGLLILEKLSKMGWLNKVGIVVMVSGTQAISNMGAAFQHDIAKFFIKDDFIPQQFAQTVYELFCQKIGWNGQLQISDEATTPSENISLKDLQIGDTRLKNVDDAYVLRIWHERNDLLRRLYYDAISIMVTPLNPGKSGTLVAKINPIYADGPGRHSVVKYGETVRIVEEIENYKQYVANFTVNDLSTQMRRYSYTAHLAGIVYSHVGANNQVISDFGDYYAKHSVREITTLLDFLFLQVCYSWYDNRGNRIMLNLTKLYQQTLGFTIDNLKQILETRLKHVQGKDVLVFTNLPDVKDLPNPLPYVAKPFVRIAHQCVTHGDLNPHNILIDDNDRPWLIDFRRTGISHILRDLAFLDVCIRIQLLHETDASLPERYQLEKVLCNPTLMHDLNQLRGAFISTNDALNKCFEVSVHLRELIYRLTAPISSDTFTDYLIAVFFIAINTIRYSDLSKTQREHALLIASLLVRALPIKGV